jgi:hypothetical protein
LSGELSEVKVARVVLNVAEVFVPFEDFVKAAEAFVALPADSAATTP